MNATLFKADTRGHANYGWLDTHHLFSFGTYMHPDRMRFGMLRVFNDDVVAGGSGFGEHPHRNMEIISIPLRGILMHQDSMGHAESLHPGDIQVMSAGSGITHSEYNGSETDEVAFLQIWIIPDTPNVEPRYDQRRIEQQRNVILPVVGPKGGGTPLWIHQRAWLSMVTIDDGFQVDYEPRRIDTGIFVFVIEGELTVSGHVLQRRDAIGITDLAAVQLQSHGTSVAVVIEVPMDM